MKINLFALNRTSSFLLKLYDQSVENADVAFVKRANESVENAGVAFVKGANESVENSDVAFVKGANESVENAGVAFVKGPNEKTIQKSVTLLYKILDLKKSYLEWWGIVVQAQGSLTFFFSKN